MEEGNFWKHCKRKTGRQPGPRSQRWSISGSYLLLFTVSTRMSHVIPDFYHIKWWRSRARAMDPKPISMWPIELELISRLLSVVRICLLFSYRPSKQDPCNLITTSLPRIPIIWVIWSAWLKVQGDRKKRYTVELTADLLHVAVSTCI